MSTITDLDQAFAALALDGDNTEARLAFYQRFADTELHVLLVDDRRTRPLVPEVFDLEEGRYVLAFDLEERLTAFTGGAAPYAALPGRVVASMLAGQGVGVGLNLGDAPSAFLMPPEVIDWLCDTLSQAPGNAIGRPRDFQAPGALPVALLRALEAKMLQLAGLAQTALLAAVSYAEGRQGHFLAFVGAQDAAQAALAKAVSEALAFSGVEAGEIDVAFLRSDDPALTRLARVAHRFDLPPARPSPGPASAPAAPGMDPERPPKLR